MTTVRADSKTLRAIIEEALGIICNAGGFTHKQLIIECLQGNMTLKLKKPVNDGEPLFNVPVDCLPAMQDFDLQFDGKMVSFEPLKDRNPPASNNQQQLMALMAALYNETDKVNLFARFSPFVAFNANRSLLTELRNSFSTPSHVFELDGEINQIKLAAFLESRCYEDKTADAFRLLPLLEFADHHVLARGFDSKFNDSKLMSVGIVYSSIKGAGKSVFICYRQKDRLASFINYGFVDSSVRFVQSVPVNVELPGGFRFVVAAGFIDDNMMPEQNFPQAVPGFRFSRSHYSAYVSNMRGTENRELEVHYLIIPRGEEIPALREVIAFELGYYEKRFGLADGEVCTPGNVLIVEKTVIEKNLAYYAQLSRLLSGQAVTAESGIAHGMLTEVIKYQRAHILNYAKKVGVEIPNH
ncbi:MAG: hypothetical protein EX270_11995 [Pseudomonadales bacterium]|nr:MAG: hypothetical protein EX270_11995 [Pseudomonadales bacterium]